MNNLEHQLILQADSSHRFFWHRLRWNFLKPFVNLNKSKKVVDVGAGSGIFADFICSDFPQAEYHFVEPSEKLSQRLDAQFGVSKNLTQSKRFENVSTVFLLDVLEHVPDDVGLIRELGSKMEPGALLVMTVPAHQLLWSRWDNNVGHLRRYNRTSLAKVFRQVQDQFEIVAHEYLFWELVPLALFRKLKLALTSSTDAMSESEVPDLPHWLNETLYFIGRIGMAIHRLIPFGTSIGLVARRLPKR